MFLKKSFKFLGRQTKIIERALFLETQSHMGASCLSEGQIIINLNMPEDVKDETLLHEILEAIKAANDLEIEHKELSIMSNCLYAVFKDNGIIK